MRRASLILLFILLVFSTSVLGKGGVRNAAPSNPIVSLPPDLVAKYQPLRTAAAVDTFVLIDEDFDGGGGSIPAGWTTSDLTAQLATFFHVDDFAGVGPGYFPIVGTQSMWCGVPAGASVPFCGYATLPGYGNGWEQILCSDAVSGDSIEIAYDVGFDTEPGYDGTVVEYTFDGGSTWQAFAVTDTFGIRSGVYEGKTSSPINEGPFNVGGTAGVNNVQVRFYFRSGPTRSDEDGLWNTDGAIIFDDIRLRVWDGGQLSVDDVEGFENALVGDTQTGIWSGKVGPAFGDFADLYPGVTVVQEDVCFFDPLFLWGFFDTPVNTAYNCHTPNPLPGQGAVPFGTPDGLYIHNEVWSPPVSNIGSGTSYLLSFDVYKDLSIDNLQFFVWKVRSWSSGCPGNWRDRGLFYYGAQRYWGSALQENFTGSGARFGESVGDLIESSATSVQVAVGVVDMCRFWCGIYGTGTCHSHAPLFDEIKLLRFGVDGPQISIRHRDLFQDTFADDGTLTGTASADVALDILPLSNPGIQPGDSVTAGISPVGTSAGGPAAWLYARVQNAGAPKGGAGLGSQDSRAGVSGARWPFAGPWIDANDNTWFRFQMDSVLVAGAAIQGRYSVDLNDALFVPGDTIHYFVGADVDGTIGNGNENYWTRTLNGRGMDFVTADREEAAASPCEFTVLPAGGFNNGGDILYVDASDDRGGPAQLAWDNSFEILSIAGLVDRFDILDPTGFPGNGLDSRVSSRSSQIDNVYRKILWNSGNISDGTVGDGTGKPSKSDDFGLLEQFASLSPSGPGIYFSGDDLAQEWSTLAGTGAVLMRTVQIPYTLNFGDHIVSGEPISPTLIAVGASFIHAAIPDELIAYGGCPILSRFDVLEPLGLTVEEFPYPAAGAGAGASAVISRQFTNTANATTTIVVSGFSFHHIRDVAPGFPPARVHHLQDILTIMGNAVPEPTAVEPGAGPVLSNYLDDNFPNPFNPTTTIRYGIKNKGHVSLRVYNVAGQLVKTLVDAVRTPAPVYRVTWEGDSDTGESVASGVYFYKLVTSNFSRTKKMVLLK